MFLDLQAKQDLSTLDHQCYALGGQSPAPCSDPQLYGTCPTFNGHPVVNFKLSRTSLCLSLSISIVFIASICTSC